MLPLWFPDLHRVDHIRRAGAITVERLCEIAETPCVASGVGITRPVVLRAAAGKAAWICAERDDGGAVEIGTPHFESVVDEARWALGCMAYSELADPVASVGEPISAANEANAVGVHSLVPRGARAGIPAPRVRARHDRSVRRTDRGAPDGGRAGETAPGTAAEDGAMKLYVVSDLHNEFHPFAALEHTHAWEQADVIVLAGERYMR